MAVFPISSSQKQKRPADAPMGRFLVTVNVISSVGPIRFVVNEGETVAAVIEAALRCYSREGRRPILGSDVNDFVFYCANSGFDVLGLRDKIWSGGSRSFVLCKKQQLMVGSGTDAAPASEASAARPGGGGGIWKAWLSSLKISSH